MTETTYGVPAGAPNTPRGLLPLSDAAAYLGVPTTELVQLARDRKVRVVQDPPSVRLYRHFWVRDLDDYLEREGTKVWAPWPRYPRDAVVYTWQAANYLDLNDQQVHKLARYDHIEHSGGGQGSAYEFRVGALDDAIERWARYW